MPNKGLKAEPFTPTSSIPVCPLHPDIDKKLEDILKKVTDIQLKLAKEEGKEEAEEKHQQKEDKESDNKISYWNQIKFVIMGAAAAFIFMLLMRLIEYFTPL